jgi:hypothetical protein
MVMSFKQRKQLGRFHRKVREAERRTTLRILVRMAELRRDPAAMLEIEKEADEWLKNSDLTRGKNKY